MRLICRPFTTVGTAAMKHRPLNLIRMRHIGLLKESAAIPNHCPGAYYHLMHFRSTAVPGNSYSTRSRHIRANTSLVRSLLTLNLERALATSRIPMVPLPSSLMPGPLETESVCAPSSSLVLRCPLSVVAITLTVERF
jgi:hypothetical protein